MKICVVTGANSGIGKAAAEKLLRKGCKVYCVGGPEGFPGDGETEENSRGIAVRLCCDLRNDGEIKRVIGAVEENGVDVLVNAAGVAFYGVSESIRPSDIADMVDVNVKAPLVITSAIMPKIRQNRGTIINISSVTALSCANPRGAAYGATKAALTSFGRSLFEEVRKQGVRVINIHPDLTDTKLYRNADFTVTGDFESTLFSEDVAEWAVNALEARDGMCVNEITLRPQKNIIVKKEKDRKLTGPGIN
ncbi:MAG: SDR family oxidoreductase [Clostridia bacterium]|nr:SDR family oxidoreductase [Clostridia bacterium]